MIDRLANIEGAVHSGKAKDERQRALQAAAKVYDRAGLPGALSLFRLIGRITLDGLSPLRDAVIAAGGATWASVSSDGSVELRENG
ncbi:hypothetical protein N5079_32640 [Planotetraspora sp. A-T 1434]|uniref:hypothetical protein n=1 Tax=Planotetraspora sp. A-T 1434 TaxID=2979219 RepID=UPI0021BE7FC9|nr:hypothetical protein [Planotetraspora sp. A-T 1434]MCT9934964.1 hypothetical protein [Planotetraspora sp. A-T 1434]